MAGFAPADRPRVVAAMTGAVASIHEASGVTIVELPGGRAIGSLELDSRAEAVDVGWLGVPPRLLVLSRYPGHTLLQLFDPRQLHPVGELALDSRLRLRATVGAHALVVGGSGAAIVTALGSTLTTRALPVDGPPVAAGAAGSQLVIATGTRAAPAASAASIEHWDPGGQVRRRRMLLPAGVTRLGGNDRWLWMTTQPHAARLELVPFAERDDASADAPTWVDLPEDIEHAVGHPFADIVACVGADTGRLYLISLEAGARVRAVDTPGIDRVEAAAIIVGNDVGVLVAQGERPIVVVGTAGHALAGCERGSQARTRRDDHVAWRSELSFAARPSRAAEGTWRGEAVAWARAVENDQRAGAAPAAPPLHALLARFDLTAELLPALVLLYGAHLAGADGASPRAVASVLDGSWSDALGRGQLAAHAIARYADSRVWLASAIARTLDELPARTGVLIGVPGALALLGPCVVVADPDRPLEAVARDCVSRIGGAILAAHAAVARAELVVEARARGAAPMWRISPNTSAVPAEPAVLVANRVVADRLDVPRLA